LERGNRGSATRVFRHRKCRAKKCRKGEGRLPSPKRGVYRETQETLAGNINVLGEVCASKTAKKIRECMFETRTQGTSLAC